MFTVVKELESSLSDVELFASGVDDSTKSLVQSNSSIVDLDIEIVNSSVETVPQSVQTCTNFNDKLLYIFTSGTTGLPKAAVIKHSRLVLIICRPQAGRYLIITHNAGVVTFHENLTPFTQSNTGESGKVDRSFEEVFLKVMQVFSSDISQNFDTIHTK